MRSLFYLLALGVGIFPCPAMAASLDGSAMGFSWALPFIGILSSIAVGPALFPRSWHAHYGKIACGWAALTLLALALGFGFTQALAAFVHAMLGEYMSFIILLFALYVVAGGILITGELRGTPATNAAILAIGTAMASFVGTTGTAMILIRPLLRANAGRKTNTHVVIFFIILVANIGGALTPLGDPPLFVGFLRGVDFFWTAQHLWLQTAITAGLVLTIFVALDVWLFKQERHKRGGQKRIVIGVRGGINFLLIAVIVAAILLAAAWKPGIKFDVLGSKISLASLARDAALLLTGLASLALTNRKVRAANEFSWEPIREVAILFAGIFVAIIPVMAMLQAGRNGSFAFLLHAVTTQDGSAHEAAYFWLTGILSAFLDNAPTYLVFFELAGGDAPQLMGPLAGTLAAISMGAVYMGALSYLGNAPNLMVYAIANQQGVRMPGFFGYFLWAALILVPLFLLLTLLPISPILKWA